MCRAYAVWFAGESDTSTSSWGSDAEEDTAGSHNSLWTLEFQAAEDGPFDFADDAATFQSSTDFSHDSSVESPSAGQSGAGEPDWVQPWSSVAAPGKRASGVRANGIQSAKVDNAVQESQKSAFQSKPMSEEHKTAIIGEHVLPRHPSDLT